MTDLSEREMVQEWMENKKYSRDEILAVVRKNKWIKNNNTRLLRLQNRH
jgi:hypothetical protein